MLENFGTYLALGFHHIVNLEAYDHLVFILVLCAPYSLTRWKDLLVLITAFTLGHSISLALATLQIIAFPTSIIEFLIPVTIFLTALNNLRIRPESQGLSLKQRGGNYLLALFFGLIHGVGFSNFLRALLGASANITAALFAFNLGLEIGQILIIALLFLLLFALNLFVRIALRERNLFLSGFAAGISIILMMQTKFW
jgi:hypothetical protein